MKSTLIIMCIISLILIPLAGNAYSETAAAEAPPVAQTLIREGDFAEKLVETLKLGAASSEAEAESTLASVGIAPRNGWIASYPMTPDILTELRDAVGDAADSGRLAMSKDEAVNALQAMASEIGLPVVSDASGISIGEESARSYTPYTDPTVINNYYYDEGPPVVTYYPPPWDYYYMYSWVPYPFWWHSFWFSGFFILHDFHKVIIVRNHGVRVCSNHVFDRGLKRVVTLDHRSRISGRTSQGSREISRARDFNSSEAQRGARSIVERTRERSRVGSTAAREGTQRASGGHAGPPRSSGRPEETVLTNRGRGPETSNGRSGGSFRGTGPDQKVERGRPPTGSNEMGERSFNRPDVSDNRGRMSFERPSGKGGNGIATGTRGDGRSIGSVSGNGRSFSGPSPSGGQRGMNFERSSPRMDRSFSAPSPSMRAPSTGGTGGSGSVQGFRGGGGGHSRGGGFARGGSSGGGGCRGRC